MRLPKATIYLTDLVHNYLGGGSYMFPLNIGFIASYAKKVFGNLLEIEIFKFPDKLIARLKDKPPDVLGLSNYTWNSHLNGEVSKLVKSLNSGTMVVWGGPNIDHTEKGYHDFFSKYSAVDFYVINEGEVGFSKLMERYLSYDGDLKKTKFEPVEGCVFYDGKTSVIGKRLQRIDKLDDIPSPYLYGLLDEFFQYNLIPIIETNRGCPYSCTFCTQGLTSQYKLKMFDVDRVIQEIDYISKRVIKTNLLCFADANFGIASRDAKIGKHIKDTKVLRNYPRGCIINWVKTRHSIEIAKIMDESLVSSLQSIDPLVLKNIKRHNIDYSHFRTIVDHINETGGISGTEIIVGLPGETKESHLNSLRMLFDWDVRFIICYNCLLIKGSELTLPEERERFALKTKFRLVDSAFGHYDGISSFECEEGIRSTLTMTEEEILFFRPIHWLIQFFWNYYCYLDILKYISTRGVNPVDLIVKIVESSYYADDIIKNIFDDFRKEAEGEWFPSPEKLRSHFGKPENFKVLQYGEVGKMNGKYIWRVILECKKTFDSFVQDVCLQMLPDYKKAIENLMLFSSNLMPDFSKELDFDAVKQVSFDYDILGWREGKYKMLLEEKAVKYKFYFSEEKKKALNTILNQYKHPNRNVTMRKMTEHMRISDLYYDIKGV